MDKLDLIIKAIDDAKDDNTVRMDKLEAAVKEGFLLMNGRVRKLENDTLRIKTVWAVGTVLVGAVWHYLVG